MKKIFLGFIVIFSLFIVTACTNDDSATNEDADGEKVISYWSNFNKGEPNQELLANIIEDYEKENPDVKIDVEWMGREVMSKVRNSMLSGEGPDLIDKTAPEIIGAIGDDTEPLNDILDKNIYNEDVNLEDAFLDNVLELYEEENKLFFIPFQVTSSGFFYDEKMFKDNGIEAPNNWKDFIETTEDLKAKDITPLAQDGNVGFYNAYYFYWLSTRINGPGAFNEAASDETGEAWDDPGFLEAAEKIEQLVNNDVFQKGYDGSQYPAAQTQWAQGKAAMTLNGSWIPQETREYASEGFEYSVFSFPSIEGGKGNNSAEVELNGWSIPKGGDVEEAKDFILFGMQEKYQQKIVDDVENISSRKGLEAPDNLGDLKEQIDESEEIHKLYDGVEGENPKWWNTIFLNTHDKLFFGEITAEEFIDSMKQQTIDFYK